MNGRTTPKAFLPFLLFCSSCLWASAVAPLNGTEYVVVKGAVLGEGSMQPLSHFYFDVYKSHPDGRKELMRTGREMGSAFRFYLEKGYVHQLAFYADGFQRAEVKISAMQLLQPGGVVEVEVALSRQAEPDNGPVAVEPKPIPVHQASLKGKPVQSMPEQLSSLLVTEESQVGLQEGGEDGGSGLQVAGLRFEVERSGLEDEGLKMGEGIAGPAGQRAAMKEAEPDAEAAVAETEASSRGPEQQVAALDNYSPKARLREGTYLRRDIGGNSRVLARLEAGAEVEVLERTTSQWWLVGYRDNIGWVARESLRWGE